MEGLLSQADRGVGGLEAGAGCLDPSPRVCLRWWGGGIGDESLAAASNGSRWLCQEPGAPPGWGCLSSPHPTRPGFRTLVEGLYETGGLARARGPGPTAP